MSSQVSDLHAAKPPAKKNATQEKISQFMRTKLDSSKLVLEGLVVEDFELIQKGTQKMIDMSNATEWQLVEGPIFAQQSSEFRNAAKDVLNYAKKKNIDGASLSYLHLTMTCIACHKQIKKSAVVMNELIPPEQVLVNLKSEKK
ncbi:MAG: hypothetical protein KDA70_12125 [Planctomycetaceae bacterium]|nr:hypothetical protein [Planctomycetaceae bacterium]